jgi:hypothetical protein
MRKSGLIVALLVCMFLVAGAGSAQKVTEGAIFELDSLAPGGSRQTCDVFDTYQQPLDPANFAFARTSDEQPGFEVSEASVDAAAMIVPLDSLGDGSTVAGVRLWGLSLEFNLGFIGECTADFGSAYNVTTWTDAAGAPGAPVASVMAVPSATTNTGIPFAFAEIWEIDFTGLGLDATGASWLSVERTTGMQAPSGADCYFLWVDESLGGTYDDMAYQAGAVPPNVPTDHAVCIDMSMAAPTLPAPGLAILAVLLMLVAAFALRRRFA